MDWPRTIDETGSIDPRDWDEYKENSYVEKNSNGTYTDKSTGKVHWEDGTVKE